MMYALIIMFVVSTGGASSAIAYFTDKSACEENATMLTQVVEEDGQHWIEHAIIKCMPVQSAKTDIPTLKPR
jgi:hypothetical protein